MNRETITTIASENGVELSKGLVNQLMNAFNEEKRNALIEASNKALDDFKDWLSPEEAQALRDEVDTLNAEKQNHSDYDVLKKYHDDALAHEEETRKMDFLKSVNVKEPYAKLVMGQLDWTKAKYDETKKTYTGLDDQIKESKANYKDLYSTGERSRLSFEGGSSSTEQPSNSPNTSMNNFIRGISNK